MPGRREATDVADRRHEPGGADRVDYRAESGAASPARQNRRGELCLELGALVIEKRDVAKTGIDRLALVDPAAPALRATPGPGPRTGR